MDDLSPHCLDKADTNSSSSLVSIHSSMSLICKLDTKPLQFNKHNMIGHVIVKRGGSKKFYSFLK